MAQTLSSNSGVWREMEIPSLPTQSRLRVFFFSSLLFFAPSTLSECLEQIISPESVTSVILSPPHPRIPRGNYFYRSDREKRSSTGSSAWAFLPTRVTAHAFLTEFAIEWTPRVGRTLVKLSTLPLSCKCRLLIHGETYLEVQWNPVNTYSGLSDKKSRGH